MSPFAVAFFSILTVSFATAMLCTQPQPSSKSARRRLVVIQKSVRPQNQGAYGTELKEADQRSHSARLGVALERYQFTEKLSLLLIHANSNLGVGGTVLSCTGVAFCGAVVSFSLLHSFVLSVVVGIAGSSIPIVLLRFKRSRRLKAFNMALPDAIDLMARSLRAGHAMGSAIEFVAEHSPQPLGFEFVQVYQQQRLGLQFRDALLKMGTRIPSKDLQFMITAILVQKETGGDLTEILDRASHVIRERVRIEGEVRTRTAQGRLTGSILGLLPLIMLALINLANPGYSNILFQDPVGRQLLYGGGTLIVLGALVIRKIVDVQV